MSNNDEKDGDDWRYFSKLKSISPTLYRVCLVMIALGAGLAIFRTVKQGSSYEEIGIFVGAGILFYCIGIMLMFFTKTEARSVVFSAFVLLAYGSWYVIQSSGNAFFTNLGPSAQSQLTWCSFPIFANLCSDTIGAEGMSIPQGTDETSPDGSNLVYFQFAGLLNRETDIIPFVTKLCGNEYRWNIQGCDSGGERTHAAAGVNVVRFYHEEDRANAQRLANAVLDAGPPQGTANDLQVQMLDAANFGFPAVGTLEVWISN